MRMISEVGHALEVSIWKGLCSVSDVAADMGDCIVQGFIFKVNSGASIKFWKHKRLGEESIQAVFPRLYRISAQKEAMIVDMVNTQNQDNWNFQFTRRLRDWEKDQLQYLGLLLSVVQLLDSDDDCLQWKWSKDLPFSVKSLYSKWEDLKFMENKELLSIWKNICPPKTEIFAWMAVQNCIASISLLVRRGIIQSNHDVCPFCNSQGESTCHLLLFCQYAWRAQK